MIKKEQLYGLDIIRGISALLIVMYHYTVRYNDSPYTMPEYFTHWGLRVSWGSMAVIAFFLLSGFLSGVYSNGDALIYLKKRFYRIYPTFAICCLITSVLIKLFYPIAFVRWKWTLINLTLLPVFIGKHMVDGVYWTLQYELIFYLFVIVLYLLSFSKKKKQAIILVWLIGTIFLAYINIPGMIGTLMNLVLIPKYLGVFISGVCIREILLSKFDVADIILLVVGGVNTYIYLDNMSFFFYIICIIAMVFLVRKNSSIKQNNFFVKMICFVASISYPLYLMHQMIGYAIICKF